MSPRRAALVWVLLAVGLTATLLPWTVLAQETPGPAIQVVVEADREGETIKTRSGSTEFTFTVSFVCLSGANEYGECTGAAGDQELLISMRETRTPYPQGWAVTVGALPSSSVQAKETFEVDVRVKLDQDEPEEDRFAIGLEFTAQPMSVAGLPDPIQGNLAQSSTAEDAVSMDKRLTLAENIIGTMKDYAWPLLGAAVILLVAGAVLVPRKKAGTLAINSDRPDQPVLPGRGTSFPVHVMNDSKDDDRVQLLVSDLPPGWVAIVPLTEIDLSAGERTQLWVTVRAPATANAGESLTFEIAARSLRAGHREAKFPLHVTVGGMTHSVPAVPSMEAPPPLLEVEADAYAMPQRPEVSVESLEQEIDSAPGPERAPRRRKSAARKGR